MFNPIIKDKIFSKKIYQYLGEITGEYKNKTVYDKQKQEWILPKNDTMVMKLLEKYRGAFDENNVGYSIFNLVEIIKTARGELSGLDLSSLDLRKVNINSVICSRSYDKESLAADFSGSTLTKSTFVSNGHDDEIKTGILFKNKLYTGGLDNKIKIWDIESKQFLEDVTIHSDWIIDFIIYNDNLYSISKNGEVGNLENNAMAVKINPPPKINFTILNKNNLFLFEDNFFYKINLNSQFSFEKISIANKITKGFVFSIKKNKNKIILVSGNQIFEMLNENELSFIFEIKENISAIYMKNSDEILIGTDNGKIYLINLDNSKILNEIEIHRGFINDIIYIDDNIFLSAGKDGYIIPFKIDSNNQIFKLDNRKKVSDSINKIILYGKNKFITLDRGHNINFWDYEKSMPEYTIEGIFDWIEDVYQIPNSDNLLISSRDGEVKYIENGIVKKTYLSKNGNWINSSILFNGKVITASKDGYIRFYDFNTGEIEKKICIKKSENSLLNIEKTENKIYIYFGKKEIEKIFELTDNFEIKELDINKLQNKIEEVKRKKEKHKNTIKIGDINFENIPGLYFQNCDFFNINIINDSTNKFKNIIRIYGGILDENTEDCE